MASSGKAAVGACDRDPLDAIDIESELQKRLEILASHSFPTDYWDSAAINRLPMTVSRFIKIIKVITGVAGSIQRGNVIRLGIIQKFYIETRTCTLRALVSFCEFLKTPPGLNAMRAHQYRLKYERRVAGQQDVASTALLTIAKLQFSDLRRGVETIRADYEKRYAELQRQMQAARAEEKRTISQLKKKFRPASQYHGIASYLLTSRCITMYHERRRERNVAPRPIDDEQIAVIEARYSSTVKDEHLLEFIAEESRKKSLNEWINRRSASLRKKFLVRRATARRRTHSGNLLTERNSSEEV